MSAQLSVINKEQQEQPPWLDNFIDIYSPVTFNLITLLDTGVINFTGNSLNEENIFLPFNNPISLQNNQRYLFCVRNYEDSLRTG